MTIGEAGGQTPEKIYAQRLDNILDRPLTPEIIDTYADDALNDVITLAHETVASWPELQSDEALSAKDREMLAFELYGLQDIGEILDHISALSQKLSRIDSIIRTSSPVNSVLVPPTGERPSTEGEGGQFVSPELIAREKTILFLLAAKFGINVENKAELNRIEGVLTNDMMRKTSYVLLEAISLGRSILVCDEEGNRTFVFDTAELIKAEIDGRQLVGMQKPQLDALIDQNPNIGMSMNYSENFVNRMAAAIVDPATKNVDILPDASRGLLRPRVPEGKLSLGGIVKASGLHRKNIVAAYEAAQLEEDFGEVEQHPYDEITIPVFNMEQADKIIAYAKERQLQPMPADRIPNKDLIAMLNSTEGKFRYAVARLRATGQLETGEKYLLPSGQQSLGWSIADGEKIKAELAFDLPPGAVLYDELPEVLGVNRKTIRKGMDRIVDDIGELGETHLAGKTSKYLFVHQAVQLRQELAKNPVVAKRLKPFPPIDETAERLSEFGVSKLLGIRRYMLTRLIAETGLAGRGGLTDIEVEIVRDYSQRPESKVYQEAPEGVESHKTLKNTWHVKEKFIDDAAAQLEAQGLIKPGQAYLFSKSGRGIGRDPEDQAKIKALLESEGRIAPMPTDGQRTASSFASLLKVSFSTAERALRNSVENDDEVSNAKVSGTVSPNYSRAVQERALQRLAKSKKSSVAARFKDKKLSDFEPQESAEQPDVANEYPHFDTDKR